MTIRQAILERRTVHTYDAGDVPIELVHQAMEQAIHAPNHRKTWPWYFVVAKGKTKAKFAELSIKHNGAAEELSEAKKTAIKNNFLNASYIVGLAQKRSDCSRQTKEDYASMACAVQNMSLFFWEHEVGSKWSSGEITRGDEAYEYFNVDKTLYELVGFMWIGKPQRIPATPKRPSAEEFYQVID